MSSDTCIAIGIFPNKNTKEYRVIYTQGIDNCDFDFGNQYVQDCQIVIYWKDAIVFDSIDEAYAKANDILDAIGYCEYGILEIDYDRPIANISLEEANKVMDEWYGQVSS